jgi:hypothetical protein
VIERAPIGWGWVLAAIALEAAGCRSDAVTGGGPPEPSRVEQDGPSARPPACELAPIPLRTPAAPRVVAVGDLHGDLSATRRALRLAGALSADDHWAGGDLVLVQTGDVLDRGDDEAEILDLFARLRDEASAAGGRVIRLNGNHELMNAAGDFRYVTAGGFADFVHLLADDAALGDLPSAQRGRAAAFFPGGPWARRLADANIVAIVGDTVFAHGGILPADAGELERMNLATRCWLIGRGGMPGVVTDLASPVWSREYATAPEPCELLQRTLDALDVERMVVGHTTNTAGITSACGGRVWRIDVGLASVYGGPNEVLEIRGDEIRSLVE